MGCDLPLNAVKSVCKRLTREEKKAQTRQLLIEMGRLHILKYGLGNAVAERIAEDAGFSRGAFYGNFADKDDLLIAVMTEDHKQRYSIFYSIAKAPQSGEQLLRSMKEAFIGKVTDGEWLFLHAEFEAAALRSAKVRAVYVDLHSEMLREGQKLLDELVRGANVSITLNASDLVLAMTTLSQGLAVNQRLLGPKMPAEKTRKILATIFDRFINSQASKTR